MKKLAKLSSWSVIFVELVDLDYRNKLGTKAIEDASERALLL